MPDLTDIINDIVKKVKSDPDLLTKFTKDPVKALESITGLDLPDDQINKVIEGVTKNLDLSDVGSMLGNLFK